MTSSRLLLSLAGAVLTLSGCAADGSGPGLVADLRQSSRDAALGRMQVWVGNPTDADVTPTAIAYVDPHSRAPSRASGCG